MMAQDNEEQKPVEESTTKKHRIRIRRKEKPAGTPGVTFDFAGKVIKQEITEPGEMLIKPKVRFSRTKVLEKVPTIPEADLESTENKNLTIVHKAELERLKMVKKSKPEPKVEKKLTKTVPNMTIS